MAIVADTTNRFKPLEFIGGLDKANDGEFRLAVILALHANKVGVCWPGRELLAKRTGTTVTTVTRRLESLNDKGIITRRRRFGKSSLTTLANVTPVQSSQQSDNHPSVPTNVTPESPRLLHCAERQNCPVELSSKNCPDDLSASADPPSPSAEDSSAIVDATTSQNSDKLSPPLEPSDHTLLRDFFCAKWSAKYDGKKYPFAGGKDAKLLKTLLDRTDGLKGAKAAIRRYLEDDSDFFRGHDLGRLVSQVARFLVDRKEKANDGEWDNGFVRKKCTVEEIDELLGNDAIVSPSEAWDWAGEGPMPADWAQRCTDNPDLLKVTLFGNRK